MNPWRRVGFCVKCNTERHYVKAKRANRCIVCLEPVEVKGKGPGGWNAEKTVGPYSGKVRDSKAEARREPTLQAWSNAGKITDLVYAGPRFDLEVYGTLVVEALLVFLAVDITAKDPKLGRLVADVIRSRRKIGSYTPDASYVDHKGERVAEDIKGHMVSRDFSLRAKLMEVCHNLPVTVIREQRGIQQSARGAGVKGPHVGARLLGGR